MCYLPRLMLPCSDPRGSVFDFGRIVGGWDCCVLETGNWFTFNVSKLDVCSMITELFDANPKVIRKCVGFRPMHVTAAKWQLTANGSCDFRFTGNFISNSVPTVAATLTDWMSMCVTSTNGRQRISSFVKIGHYTFTSGKRNDNKYVGSISFL